MTMPPGGYAAPPPPQTTVEYKAFRGPAARIAVAQTINGGLGLLGMLIAKLAICIGVFFGVLFGFLLLVIALLAAVNGIVSWVGVGGIALGLFALAILVAGFGYLFGAKWSPI